MLYQFHIHTLNNNIAITNKMMVSAGFPEDRQKQP